MKISPFWGSLTLLFLSSIPQHLSAQTTEFSSPVEVSLVSETNLIVPGKPFWVALHLKLEPGWHVYGDPPGEAGYPVMLAWNLPEGFTAGSIQWPEAETFLFEGITSYGYSGDILLPVLITPSEDLLLGETTVLKAQASWLACEIVCIPGRASLNLELGVGAHTNPSLWAPVLENLDKLRNSQASSITISKALLFAFIGGLILNLMPCVFPVLGLKVLGFMKQAHEQSYKIRLHGLAFVGGVLAFFGMLVGLLLGLREAGVQLGWGFQLQSPLFLAFLSALFFVMGLNFAGVFEWGALLSRTGGQLDTHRGYGGSFLSGALVTLVATPCTAPFMGTAIGFALTQSPAYAGLVFMSLGLGVATPVLILSFFPRSIKALPKPGPWMNTLKQGMSFPLFATVIWLLWVFGQQRNIDRLVQLLFGLLMLGVSAWIYGCWCNWNSAIKTRKKALVWIALFLAISFIQIYKASYESTKSDAEAISWMPFSPAMRDSLRAQGKGVFIDFTAAWCLTCQVNERIAINNPSVSKRFAELDIAMMKADWTQHDPVITSALAELGRSGVPFYILYVPEAEPIIFPEILLPDIVLEKLDLYESILKAQ